MMNKQVDWKAKAAYARRLTVAELHYAIADCVAASRCIDEGYYRDEASVYRTELNRRKVEIDETKIGRFIDRIMNLN